jgi:hypothetical protein
MMTLLTRWPWTVNFAIRTIFFTARAKIHTTQKKEQVRFTVTDLCEF